MRIVFLDIDGVLNHSSTKERFQNCIGIDEGNLYTFSEFLKIARMEEETEVVLTSSWREDKNREGESVSNGYGYICDRLDAMGIHLYDVTPVLSDNGFYSHRGAEIAKWLENHNDLKITGYVILDDEHSAEFKEYGLSKRWIRTSWESARGGFQPKHVKKAFEMLQMPYYAPEKTQK